MSLFELRKKIEELKELSKDLTRRIEHNEKRVETLDRLLSTFKRDIPREWR